LKSTYIRIGDDYIIYRCVTHKQIQPYKHIYTHVYTIHTLYKHIYTHVYTIHTLYKHIYTHVYTIYTHVYTIYTHVYTIYTHTYTYIHIVSAVLKPHHQ